MTVIEQAGSFMSLTGTLGETECCDCDVRCSLGSPWRVAAAAAGGKRQLALP
jgi:hypothetical protein